MDYKHYLYQALGVVFNNKEDLGFWDSQRGRIIGRLVHDAEWQWKSYDDGRDRYGVFTITAILLAKFFYNLDTTAYDDKIRTYLEYIRVHAHVFTKSEITYGAFNALILGPLLYKEFKCEKEATRMKDFIINHLGRSKDNQDFLYFIGLSLLAEHDKEARVFLEKEAKRLLESLTPDGYFKTGDIRYPYHQRIMYGAWGLAFVSRVFLRQEIRIAIDTILSKTWNCRRDFDNAFIWHPPIYWFKKWGISMPVIAPYSASYLFECHQTFFVNAVNLFQQAFKTEEFQCEKEEAMAWIYGNNRINRNLVEITGIGVPIRLMSKDGELSFMGENFKGSYELGSYIFALASL